MKKLKLNKMGGNLLLLAVTLMWGSGFIATKFCLDNGMNSGMVNIFRGGLLFLLTLVIFPKRVLKMKPKEALIGILAGLANGIAFALQGMGQEYTQPATSSFLTVLYVIFVPLLMLIFFRKRPSLQLIPAVVLSLVGTYFLTGMSFSNFKMGIGEIITIVCAFFFGLSIVIIGKYGQSIDGPIVGFWMGITHTLSGVVYFFVSGGLKTVADAAWIPCILPLLWLGSFCTFFTSNAQVISQKVTDETTASIIMTLEAFFATVFSLIFGYDKFTWRLGVGGALILVATMTAVADFPRIFAWLRRAFSGKKGNSAAKEEGENAQTCLTRSANCHKSLRKASKVAPKYPHKLRKV